MITIVGIDQINVGWVDNNYIAFITSVVLARHKLLTRRIKINPFVIEYGKLWASLSNNPNSIYYAVGSFSDDEIEQVLAKKCRVTIIGKLYGKKFGFLAKPIRIGSVKIYPVPKKKENGLEYISVLANYFKLSSEIPFFLRLADMRSEMLVILAVTDSWIDVFKLLISSETVSSPDIDINKVIDYIKKTKNYEEMFNKFTNSIKNSIVVRNRNYTVLDISDTGISLKRAEIISKHLFRDTKILFLITRNNPAEEGYNIGIALRKKYTKINLDRLLEVLDSTLVQDRGSLKVLKTRISDLNTMIEKIDMIAKMLDLSQS